MAYVNRSSVGCRGSSGERSAQAIILTGFLIAIAVVVIAVLLNSLIFAQDLSTRDDGVDDRGILGFAGDVDRMSYDIANTLGHNSSGEVNQSYLFTPDEAEDNFRNSLYSFQGNATYHSESRQAVTEVEMNSVESVWSVGQMPDGDDYGRIENGTGEDRFEVFGSATEEEDDPVESIELYVEVDFSVLGGGDSGFRTGVYESELPPTAQPDREGSLWELDIVGDDVVNITRNESGTFDYRDISVPSGTDNITVEIDVQDEEACLRFDRDDDCHTDSDDLMPEWINDEDVTSVAIENIEGWDGGYEYRLSSDVDAADLGVCEEQAPCVDDLGDYPIHEVGVVHDASYSFSYVSGDVEHVREVEGVSARQEDFKLDKVVIP